MATKRLSALRANGERIDLEVTSEMTGRELKRQIRELQTWDEFTRRTTVVELVLGERLLGNDETVTDAGLTADAVVSVVFKPNTVRCSNRDAIASFCGEFDSELFLMVEIPGHDTQISARAFAECEWLAEVTIPDSVTHIDKYAFHSCEGMAKVTMPDSVIHIGKWAWRTVHLW